MKESSNRSFARVLQRMPYLADGLYEICLDCTSKACISACPESVIALNPDGVANLEFTKSGCVFCQECVIACYRHNGEHEGFDCQRQEVNARMRIDPVGCLAWNGSICSSCKDACPCEISFVGMFYPEVIDCNGCGLCVARCPMDAIKF